jgi:hypothetical protein
MARGNVVANEKVISTCNQSESSVALECWLPAQLLERLNQTLNDATRDTCWAAAVHDHLQ